MMGLVLGSVQDLLLHMILTFGLMKIFQSMLEGKAVLLGWSMLLMVAGFLVMGLLSYVGAIFFGQAGLRASGRLRKALVEKLLHLPATWYDKQHSGDVLSRATADMQAAEQALGWHLMNMTRTIVGGIGGAVVMFLLDVRMAVIAIGVGLIAMWLNARFMEPVKRVSDAIQKENGVMSGQTSDLVASASVIRLYNLAEWAGQRIGLVAESLFRLQMRRTRCLTGQRVVGEVAGTLQFFGLIAIGSVGIMAGALTFPVLLGVVQISNSVNHMFRNLGESVSQLQKSLAGVDRVLEVLDEPEEDLNGKPVPETDREAPIMEMEAVSFSYTPEESVLTEVSETVHAGENIALVGGSGSGKSTLLRMLMGLYEPVGGKMLLRGTEFDQWPLGAWRKSIAYVPQHPFLFEGSIRENISCAKPDASEDAICKAARDAQAHDFIMTLPGGYDTLVGERGAQLSGGQRQRIAIARAILRDAPMLFLDEATAALDSQSEQLVQDALSRLMKGRTTFVVAHRLSTVRHADRILVLEDGSVKERGRHEELLALDGRYASLLHSQFVVDF